MLVPYHGLRWGWGRDPPTRRRGRGDTLQGVKAGQRKLPDSRCDCCHAKMQSHLQPGDRRKVQTNLSTNAAGAPARQILSIGQLNEKKGYVSPAHATGTGADRLAQSRRPHYRMSGAGLAS